MQYLHLSRHWNSTFQLLRAASTRGPRHYEFPTGYNYLFGSERFTVGEQFFVHSPQLVVSIPLSLLCFDHHTPISSLIFYA